MSDNPLIGKTITEVLISEDGAAIKFVVLGGEPIVARADGDCCSQSWIEDMQGVDQIINSPIVAVEEVGDMPEVAGNRYDHYEEEMAYYGCKITSGKGYALIDYRNSSNGYYGGSLSWGEDYHYGGVYGQNTAKNDTWRTVA